MASDEMELKEQLLGAVKRPARTGDHRPDKAQITAPYKHSGVVKTFCSGCGHVIEIIPRGALILAEESGNPVGSTDELHGKFFEVDRCFVCDRGFLGSIRMRDIDELA